MRIEIVLCIIVMSLANGDVFVYLLMLVTIVSDIRNCNRLLNACSQEERIAHENYSNEHDEDGRF